MAAATLYPGEINSLPTFLTAPYTVGDGLLNVDDTGVFPAAPNIVVVAASATDITAVTYIYTAIGVNQLTGVTLLEGTDKDWPINTPCARNFTNYDWLAVQDQIALRAPIASPTFTGTPAAPTAAVGDNTTQLATTAFHFANLSNRNAIINGDCRVNQRVTAQTLVKDQYTWDVNDLYGPDRHEGMATGTAVSAGTFGQSVASLAGSSGYGFLFSAVTLTGTGILYQRHRIEARDAARFKNKTASFSCKVYHDVGSAINYTIYIRKPTTTADTFSAVTAISNSGAISVANATETTIKYEGISMGDCSKGIEIEIKIESGAITTKNFYLSEWQLELGAVATEYEFRSYAHELLLCVRYALAIIGISGIGIILGINQNVNSFVFTQPFSAPMRTYPTVSLLAAGGYQNDSSALAATCWRVASGSTGTPVTWSTPPSTLTINNYSQVYTQLMAAGTTASATTAPYYQIFLGGTGCRIVLSSEL